MHAAALRIVRRFTERIGDRRSLASRTAFAGLWSIGGQLASQGLRLAGNLVLTRLLYPEAFGLMAIVQTVMLGIHLMSDFGTSISIIQSRRGHEENFVNTAWTLQIVRGLCMWVLLCLLAPWIADFYGEPELRLLTVAVGFGAVLGGFASTKTALANRQLEMKKIVLLEVGSYVLSLAATILLALAMGNVWALVAGSLFGVLVNTVASHLCFGGIANKPAWEPAAARELFGVGHQILLSSTMTFLCGEGGKLIIAKYLDVHQLALFTLASTMSALYVQLAGQLAARVLFPSYSILAREQPERLHAVSRRSRLVLIAPGWLLGAAFAYFGEPFMSLLYDTRYAGSGQMLCLLSLGQLLCLINTSYNGLLFAKGEVRWVTIITGSQFLIQLACLISGFYLGGAMGVVIGAAIVNWLAYPIQAYAHARIGLWDPRIDFPLIGISLLLAIHVLHGQFGIGV